VIESSPQVVQVRLTPGNSADLDDVMEVMTGAFHDRFGEAWTRSQCAGILPMSGVSLTVARDAGAGRPLGFSLFRTVADESELLLLAVSPAYQRRGIARRLLEEFIESARADGADRVHLEVRDGNPAVEMYRAAGFETAGRRRHYYLGTDGERFDALTLARNL
jgi:ribosomal-protein-alanine N-acetyltransferase